MLPQGEQLPAQQVALELVHSTTSERSAAAKTSCTDIPRFAQNHSGSEHYPFDLRIYGEVPEERARAARASDGQLPELLPLVD